MQKYQGFKNICFNKLLELNVISRCWRYWLTFNVSTSFVILTVPRCHAFWIKFSYDLTMPHLSTFTDLQYSISILIFTTVSMFSTRLFYIKEYLLWHLWTRKWNLKAGSHIFLFLYLLPRIKKKSMKKNIRKDWKLAKIHPYLRSTLTFPNSFVLKYLICPFLVLVCVSLLKVLIKIILPWYH